MLQAEVGDDVFGDDPSVNHLEALAAERMGKEAAVFLPSGTMANLVAVLSHTQPTDEVLLGNESHLFNYEVAGASRVGGVQLHPLPNDASGGLADEDVRTAIREPNIHSPRTSLLCLENTHNRCGGSVLPLTKIQTLSRIAHDAGVRVHLDGARIFNAEVASGTTTADLTATVDSVSFCLSKGLACPVGSLLCGSSELIERARRERKMLGGGMRQSGVLAAAGIHALSHNIERLAEDHENARMLAEGIRRIGTFAMEIPTTNIVVLQVLEGARDDWLLAFKKAGVHASAFGTGRIRMVTHKDVDTSSIEEALRRIAQAAVAVG
tara:strand:+ start:83 stop:1051 length:969 start_codon:yes stop_codon:yes gene_type:complete